MNKVSYLSECECGQELSGIGEYDQQEGTLYGQNCPKCGDDFIVLDWFDKCDECELYHNEGECK